MSDTWGAPAEGAEMTNPDSPATPVPASVRPRRPGTVASRMMMGAGATMLGAGAVIDWLGGPLVRLGHVGLHAIGLQGTLVAAGVVTLVVGAFVGRSARRR